METPAVTPEQTASKDLQFYNSCLGAIKAREQEFTTGWWKHAEAAEEIYVADTTNHSDNTPYNILYSNTEVLLPSLYSATPKPDVRTRYKEQNLKPIPEVIQRFLTVAADPASPGGDSFDGAMADCVLSSLVPGMGYVRLRYVEDASFPIRYESGHFKTLIWGKGSRWSKVPWIAFRVPMTRDQMLKQFNKTAEEAAQEYKPSSEAENEKDACVVYEMWDKKTGTVMYLCEEWNSKLLQKSDDPLGLENFFPTPGLMMMTARSGKMLPIPLYNYYKTQADELNRVSVRLIKVLSAIRVRGVYNGLLGDDLAKLLNDDQMENALMPAAEAGLLVQNGGLDRHIWLLPIEDLITVAKELYAAREAVKQVIYEITGISDIIRGSSAPSETATAQDLKNKWGTVRLRRMQSVVANYARDLFRMSVDCGSDKIAPEEWANITQLAEIPTAQQKQVAQQQLQYLQMQAQAMQANIPPPMPGQPPPPGPPPPDPKLLQAAQSPSWEEILGKVKDDKGRLFIINIQTSSTIDLDTAQDKAEVNEFMAAMGQLLPGLQGFVQLPGGIEAAKEILKQVCLRYKFGIDIADVISQIKPPPPQPPEQKGPPPPSPAEIQATEAVAQSKIMKAASDTRVAQAQESAAMADIENQKIMGGIAIQEAQLRLEESRAKLAHEGEMRKIKQQTAKAAANAPKPTATA
jgi:hypothetical protein